MTNEIYTDPKTNTKYEILNPVFEQPELPGVYKVLRLEKMRDTETVYKIYYSKWTGEQWLLVCHYEEEAELHRSTVYSRSEDMYNAEMVKGWLREVAKETKLIPVSRVTEVVTEVVTEMLNQADIDSAIAFLTALKNESVAEMLNVLLKFKVKK